MKKLLTLMLVVLAGSTVFAASKVEQLPDWQNPNVVERNRLPMSATFDAAGLKLSLNGTWKFQWYESIPARSPDFYNLNYDDRTWDEMPVPGMLPQPLQYPPGTGIHP